MPRESINEVVLCLQTKVEAEVESFEGDPHACEVRWYAEDFACHVGIWSKHALFGIYQTNILRLLICVSSDWSSWNRDPRVAHLIEVPQTEMILKRGRRNSTTHEGGISKQKVRNNVLGSRGMPTSKQIRSRFCKLHEAMKLFIRFVKLLVITCLSKRVNSSTSQGIAKKNLYTRQPSKVWRTPPILSQPKQIYTFNQP